MPSSMLLHRPAAPAKTKALRVLSACSAVVLACLAVTSCAQSGLAARRSNVKSLANPGATPVRVALYRGPGTAGAGPSNLMAHLNRDASTMTLTQVTPQEIQGGVLSNYDAVIFAGGSSSVEAKGLGETGRAAVKKFIADGGGYIRICAGAYLATTGYPWSLHIINAKTISPKWQRGGADVKMDLTQPGGKILGQRDGQFDVHYHNGPIVEPSNEPGLPPFTTLAHFRTEVARYGSVPGIMSNSPAIFAGQYQNGRVVCISPHPEQTVGLDYIVPRAVEWATDESARKAGQR